MTAMALFHDFVTIEVVVWWWAMTLGLLEGPSAPSGGERSTRHRTTPFVRFVRGIRSCRHCSVGMCSTGVGALALAA